MCEMTFAEVTADTWEGGGNIFPAYFQSQEDGGWKNPSEEHTVLSASSLNLSHTV